MAVDVYPIPYLPRVSAKISLQESPLDFILHSSLTINMTYPCWMPKSGPAFIQIFLRHGAFKCALTILEEIRMAAWGSIKADDATKRLLVFFRFHRTRKISGSIYR